MRNLYTTALLLLTMLAVQYATAKTEEINLSGTKVAVLLKFSEKPPQQNISKKKTGIYFYKIS